MQKPGSELKSIFVILAATAWPFATVWSQNILGGQLNVGRVGVYFLISSAVMLFVYAVARRLLRGRAGKGTVAVSVAVLTVLFYSYVVTKEVADAIWGQYYLRTWIAFVLVAAPISLWAMRFDAARKLVRIGVYCLLISSFTPLLQYAVGVQQVAENDDNKSAPDNGTPQTATTAGTKISFKQTPDLFWVIFDTYPRADTLREVYGFSNDEFLNRLKEMDFIVSSKPTSNYTSTPLSVGSTLNLDYIIRGFIKREDAIRANNSLAGKSKVHDIFRDNGYRMAHWIWNGLLNCDEFEEGLCFRRDSLKFDELESALISWTPLNSLAGKIEKRFTGTNRFEAPDVLAALQKAPTDKPLFGLIHITVPHDPYRFKADCQPVSSSEYRRLIDDKRQYVDQVQCANIQSQAIIDTILKRNPNSVIILQSDTGPSWSTVGGGSLDEAFYEKNIYHPIQLADGTGSILSWKHAWYNFNAWRLPAGLDCQLQPGFDELTSVNTFRILFSCLSGQPMALKKPRWFYLKKTRAGNAVLNTEAKEIVHP